MEPMDLCFNLPHISNNIFSHLDKADVESMEELEYFKGSAPHEVRRREEEAVSFTLGSFQGIRGVLSKRTRSVEVRLTADSTDTFLWNIQLSSVSHVTLDIVIEDSFSFTPIHSEIIASHRLTICSFQCKVDILRTLCAPLHFEGLKTLHIKDGTEPDRNAFVMVVGACQPEEITVPGEFLNYPSIIGQSCMNLKKLETLDAFLYTACETVVMRNIAGALNTLTQLELNSDISTYILQYQYVFVNLKGFSIEGKSFSQFNRLSVMFPSLVILEIKAARKLSLSNIVLPAHSIRVLRFKYKPPDTPMEVCPPLRDVFLSAESVEWDGSDYSVESMLQFHASNQWARKVVMTGEFCCPEKITSLQFIDLLTECKELHLAPRIKQSKIPWAAVEGSIRGLQLLERLFLKCFKNVKIIDRLSTQLFKCSLSHDCSFPLNFCRL